jgi:hypothetical protein
VLLFFLVVTLFAKANEFDPTLYEQCAVQLVPISSPNPTVDGQPKDGRVDYKLINQFLLQAGVAIKKNGPQALGFLASTIAPWGRAPVRGIRLSGQLQPPHLLAGELIEILIQRRDYYLIIVVTSLNSHKTWARKFVAEELPKYSLLGIVKTVQSATDLQDWTSFGILE